MLISCSLACYLCIFEKTKGGIKFSTVVEIGEIPFRARSGREGLKSLP